MSFSSNPFALLSEDSDGTVPAAAAAPASAGQDKKKPAAKPADAKPDAAKQAARPASSGGRGGEQVRQKASEDGKGPRQGGDRPQGDRPPRPARDGARPESSRGRPPRDGFESAPSERRPRAEDRGDRRPRNEGDADARGKREFDRRSGTGRGKEVSKNGGGARNWGKPTDEIAPVKDVPAVDAEGTETKTEETAAAAPVGVIDEPAEKTLTLEQWQKQQAAAKATFQVRKLEASVTVVEKGLTLLKKEDAGEMKVVMTDKEREKKAVKKEVKKPAKQDVTKELFANARPPPIQGSDRGDRRGGDRRGDRSDRGGQQGGRGKAINFADDSAFPALA